MTKIEEGKSGEILGEAVILNTQAGNNLKAILEVTDMVGASSRGFGKLKGDGKTIDEGTFDFKTVDFVAEPSTRGAYVVPVKEDIEEVRLKEIEDSLTEIKSRFEADKSEDDLVKDAATLAELSAELGSVTDHSLMKARVSEILENVKTIVSSKTETNIGSEEMDPLIEERLKSIEEGQIEDSAAVAQLENIQVKAGMLEECLDEMSNRYNELESQKDEEIAGIQQQLQTSQAREQAAETLLQEQLDSSNGNNDEVSTIQTRLEAAEELLEAFMDRSQEKQEESNELQTRYDVAEHLLDEHLQEENKSEIKEYVDELTAGLKSAVRETLSKQLVKCESKEEVDETYAELAPLARGKSVSRVPLPNEGGPDNEKLLNEESTSGDEFEQLEEESHPEAYQTFKGLRKLSPGMK
jgi:DNA repair exonuclease SbcCD ATPase subunit